MLGILSVLASVLAALVAATAFAFGVTRSSRLRRREQLFRESLTAIGTDDPRRDVVQELHRAALAELIARQLTPAWRLLWPWGAWIVLAGIFTQIGFSTSDYLASGDDLAFYKFSQRVMSDPGAMIFLPFIVLSSAIVFASYITTLEGRADAAKQFFVDSSVSAPRTFTQISTEADLGRLERRTRKTEEGDNQKLRWRRRRTGVFMWLLMLMPGLFAVCLGLFSGMYIWTVKEAGDRVAALESLDAFPAFVIFAFSLTLLGVLRASAMAARDLKSLSLPSDYPSAPAQRDRPPPASVPADLAHALPQDVAKSEKEVEDVRAPECGTPARSSLPRRFLSAKESLRRLASQLTLRR